MGTVVEVVLTTVLTAGVLWLLWRFARREPEVTTLRHGPSVAVLGAVGLAFPVLFVYVLLVEPLDAWIFVTFALVAVPLGVAGAGFLGAYVGERVRLEPTGIAARDWRGRWSRVGWAEIEHVRFRRLLGDLVIDGSEGRRVSVSAWLHGSEEVVGVLERTVRAEGMAEAFRGYRQAYGTGSPKR